MRGEGQVSAKWALIQAKRDRRALLSQRRDNNDQEHDADEALGDVRNTTKGSNNPNGSSATPNEIRSTSITTSNGPGPSSDKENAAPGAESQNPNSSPPKSKKKGKRFWKPRRPKKSAGADAQNSGSNGTADAIVGENGATGTSGEHANAASHKSEPI